jgi:tartrate-resistant acid phosphatase type 5
MKSHILYLLFLISLLLSCKNFPENSLPDIETSPIAKLKNYPDGFNLFVVSDMGRNGLKNQKKIADQMAAQAEELHPEFIVSCGDNFQDDGVESIEDPLWNSEFEEVYTKPSLQMDWYPILGNHDYKGNSQAEIDYSKVSNRWRFKSRYYTFVRQINDSVSARFIFLDTTPLVGKYHKKQGYQDVAKQDSARQIAWLKAILANSKEQWKLVFGHHPIISASTKQDNASEAVQRIKPILEKYSVQFYISGHDRDLHHLKEKSGKIDYMVNGAESKSQLTGTGDGSLFCKSASAFSSVTFHGDSIRYAFININGQLEYNFGRSYK